ncbi:MAG: hypothetical protein WC668_01665 [Patescibacteria group bacterium]|jgi:hypothetical protein
MKPTKNKIILTAVIIAVLAALLAVWFLWPKSQPIIDQRYYNGPTGLNLIDRALAEEKIDSETALIYKVKFIFRDPTLPQEYFTKEFPFEEGGVFAEVSENWDKLSPTAKEILAPYFKRPDDSESYISQKLNSETQNQETGLGLIKAAQAFDRPLSYKSDDSLITADGKIKVWYLEKKETINGRENITKIYYGTAQKIVANLNTDGAYAQYVGLLGKIPPSDGTLGGDSKTDIYVVSTGYSLLLNDDNSSSQGVNAPDGPTNGSSFILIRDNLNAKHLKTTTVHEIFHAFQRAFNCRLTKANWWWIEGTATWSEDMIYPKEDSEQGYVESFMPRPDTSLFKNGDNFEYGAYLFPFYLSNTYDRMIVTKVFENCKSDGDPLASAEATIDGGFKKNWREFALWNFNQQPVEYYKKADQSKKFPADTSQKSNNDLIFLAPGENTIPTKELNPLTAQVIETFFSESQGVRKAVFKNFKNFTGKSAKGAIKAIIYPKNNGQPYIEDWTEKESRSFCFDKADDNFDKIILIFSNAELKNKIAATGIKVKTLESCYAIDQGETMTVKPIFAVTSGYVGTLKYQAEGGLVKDSVPAAAKYPYLGKWQVKVDYLEQFPPQRVVAITASEMDFAYNHYLEFDLSADSVLKDGTVEVTTKEGKFETPGWEIHNELSGQTATIPKNTTMWDVPQKGVITEMTADGCKISLPDFVLYNSGGYRSLPHPIVLEIKNN